MACCPGGYTATMAPSDMYVQQHQHSAATAAAAASPEAAAAIAEVEQAIDAEIAQLLALRQARVEQRQAQLQLLQQLAASQQNGNAASLMREITLAPQDLHVATHLAEPELSLPCSASLAPPDQTWAGLISPEPSPTSVAAAQQAAAMLPADGSCGRSSLDFTQLQLGLLSPSGGVQAFESSPDTADLARRTRSDPLLPSPFAGGAAGGGFAAPALQQQPGLGANSMGVDPELLAALGGLSGQGSAMLPFNATYSTPGTPSPAMSRIGSAALLSSMQSLQEAAACCMGETSAPLLRPASAGLAHADMLLCDGRTSSGHLVAGGMGSRHTAPAHQASFPLLQPHADLAAEARLRRHSFHVEASRLQSGLTFAAPVAPRADDPRLRRMSADVVHMRQLMGPNLQALACAEGTYALQSGMAAGGGFAQAAVPAPACAGAGAPAGNQPGSWAGQSAVYDTTSWRSFEQGSRASGAAGRQSLDAQSAASAVAGAGAGAPLLPRVGGQGAAGGSAVAGQPARKGTGVFMPRVAAVPAKGGKKGRAA